MDKHCKKHTSKPKHRSRSQLTLAGFETPFEGIFNPNLDKPEPNRKEFVILRDGNSNYRTQKKHCRRAELL